MKKLAKAGVIVAGSVAVLAGSVASAQFLSVADWFVGGGQFDHLSPVTASDGSITGPLMPGESGDVKFTIHNPNRVSVLVKVTSDSANGVQITNGPESCAQYVTQKGAASGYGPEAFRGSVPANGTVEVTAENWVKVDDDPASNCQSAQFKVHFDATAERNATYAH